jgi:transmembrane protein
MTSPAPQRNGMDRYAVGWWLGCLALCAAYLYSGFSKVLDFPGAVAEQAHFGLQPATLTAMAVIVTQLGGSALVLFGRGLWRAAGALGLAGFTAVATVIGHAFWNMQGMERFHNANAFVEHIGLIGGFLLVATQALGKGSASTRR